MPVGDIIPMKTPRSMKGSSVTSQAMLASLTKCIEQVFGCLGEMRQALKMVIFNAWKEDRNLGGGFKYCLFSPLLGEMIQFD